MSGLRYDLAMDALAERRQEERERRRVEIVDAAEVVAAEVGVDAITMDEVARRARLSRALLYVYFRDRDELLFAICERALEQLRQRFAAAAQEHSAGRDQIAAIGRAFVGFSREQAVHYDALAKFALHSPQRGEHAPNEQACLHSGDRVHEIMVGCIERGIADGSVRADIGPPALAALTLWGYMHGIILLAKTKAVVIEHRGFQTDQLIDHALKLAAEALAGPQ